MIRTKIFIFLLGFSNSYSSSSFDCPCYIYTSMHKVSVMININSVKSYLCAIIMLPPNPWGHIVFVLYACPSVCLSQNDIIWFPDRHVVGLFSFIFLPHPTISFVHLHFSRDRSLVRFYSLYF